MTFQRFSNLESSRIRFLLSCCGNKNDSEVQKLPPRNGAGTEVSRTSGRLRRSHAGAVKLYYRRRATQGWRFALRNAAQTAMMLNEEPRWRRGGNIPAPPTAELTGRPGDTKTGCRCVSARHLMESRVSSRYKPGKQRCKEEGEERQRRPGAGAS